jgi:regulator of protease activity HflC (stomatin/prohibitin superfamily)
MTKIAGIFASVVVVAGIILVPFVLFGAWTTVSSQEVTIITRFSAIDRKLDRGSGFNLKLPIIERANSINVAEQKIEFGTQAYSKDGQVIDLGVTTTFQVNEADAERIFREVRNDYVNIYLNPVITPSSEEVVSRFTAQELIDKRAEWTTEIKRLIVERLNGRGITIKSIEITKFDFDDGYENAIKSKQIAEQKALEQINVTKQEEEKKKQEILKAEALAEKTRLEAEALASQQGNKVIEKIEAEAALEAARKWNGVLPQQMVPGGALPFIDVGQK